MGVIETLKDVATLVQKTDNIEVVRQVIELQGQVYDLVTENGALKAELQRARDAAKVRAELRFEKNRYWQGSEGPFCSRCWDVDQRLVRLNEGTLKRPWCPACKSSPPDPDVKPTVPAAPRSARSGYLSRGR